MDGASLTGYALGLAASKVPSIPRTGVARNFLRGEYNGRIRVSMHWYRLARSPGPRTQGRTGENDPLVRNRVLRAILQQLKWRSSGRPMTWLRSYRQQPVAP